MTSGPTSSGWITNLRHRLEPIPAEPFELFVVAFALLLLIRFVLTMTVLMPWGAFPEAFDTDAFAKISATEPAAYPRWNLFAIGDGRLTHYVLGAVYVSALILLAIRRSGRFATGIVFALTVSFNQEFSLLLSSGDALLACIAFWLWILPETRLGASGERVVPRVSIEILQAQIVLVYVATGLHKALQPDWISGRALHVLWEAESVYVRSWSSALQETPILSAIGTFATLIFELTFPLGIWSQRLRPFYLGAGVLFHLTIELTMRVTNFTWVMLACYSIFLSAPMAGRLLHGFESVIGRGQARA